VGRRCTKEDRVAETVELENQRFRSGRENDAFLKQGDSQSAKFLQFQFGKAPTKEEV